METALMVCSSARSELTLSQAAWDMFFDDAMRDFNDPNPELCRDLALDKTVRALGQRPRGPLTPAEREDLVVRGEVGLILDENSRKPNIGRHSRKERHCTLTLADEEAFENLVDAAGEEQS